MNKELLIKYCNNSCTEEELNYVLTWIKESEGTSEGELLFSRIWDELQVEEDGNLNVNFDILLDQIHHKVNLTGSEKLLDKAGQNIIKYRKREKFMRNLTRIAAILMLPVLGFGLYMSVRYQTAMNTHSSVNQAYNEVFSSVDAITKVSLPDGSNVWLNHSSRLKYPAMFREDLRMVELTGEGYFEVAHNPNVPFVVKTGEIQFLARGTTFNIMAYPEEDEIEASLITGQVDLLRIGADGKLIALSKMKPTDLDIIKKSNYEINSLTITDDRYFSWKDGKLVFNKEPMGVVIKKLSRWFNVDIQIKDPELLELTYTATFVHETLPQVMELLALVTPVSYSISNREKNSDGTFSKRKIILNYRKK